MVVGFARVDVDRGGGEGPQVSSLEAAGCERIVVDRPSRLRRGTTRDGLLRELQQGDVLILTRLDRLGMGLTALMDLALDLQKRGVYLVSIHEGIDTRTGPTFVTSVQALAEASQSHLREVRTRSLSESRSRGRAGGRPPILSSTQIQEAMQASRKGESVKAIAWQLRGSLTTLRRALRREKI